MTDRSVVSLLPAATEIVYALGVEPAAVSHECSYPPAATDRPRANTCLVEAGATSDEINQVLETHDDIYELDREILGETDPDIVITQGVCDVCAVDSVAVREVVRDLDIDPEILTTDPHSLDDVLATVTRIGDALDRPERARELVSGLRHRISSVRAATRRAVVEAGRPRTLVIDWLDPPMVAGHWIPEMIELAGGRYGIGEPNGNAVPRPFEEIASFDPGVVVLSPCGFDVDETRRDVEVLAGNDGWQDLAAVRKDEVYAMDGTVLNCPSPRLVDALETLAFLLHPNAHTDPTATFETITTRPAVR